MYSIISKSFWAVVASIALCVSSVGVACASSTAESLDTPVGVEFTPSDLATIDTYVALIADLGEGETLDMPGENGSTITVMKIQAGLEVLVSGIADIQDETVEDFDDSASAEVPEGYASGQGIGKKVCRYAALAAITALGSVGLAILAASGGAVVAGVVLSSQALNAMSLALAGGSGIYTLISLYMC